MSSFNSILIEALRGDFSNSADPNGAGRTLTIILAEKHLTKPVVTILSRDKFDNASAYNFFINEIVEMSPNSYKVVIGMSSLGEDAWDPNAAPIIHVHAMSYQ